MALVFFVGQYFMAAPPETPPPRPEAQAPPKPEAPAKPEAPKAAPPATQEAVKTDIKPPTETPAPSSPRARPPQRLATVETPLYRAVVSSEGGKLQELTLEYRGKKPLVILGELGPAGIMTGASGKQEPLPMEIAPLELKLDAGRPTGDIVLTGEVDGVRVRKTLSFRADTYTIETKIHLENAGRAAQSVALAYPWTTRQAWEPHSEKFQGQHPTTIAMKVGDDLRYTDDLAHPGWYHGCMSTFLGPTKNGEQLGIAAHPGDWIALGSSWYETALVAKAPGFEVFTTSDPQPADSKVKPKTPLRASVGLRAAPTLAPGAAWDGAFVVYAGPKEYGRLRDAGLEDSINFGGFPLPRECGGLPMKWFAVPILLIMNWVYTHVHNYGVAIIILTVLSKVLFYPLTVWSMRSMKAMQALQPKINTLRSKYKSDPQRLQRETMELYRQHGVNPLGGCLPMLPQIPIFYALYLAVANSAELQGAPFLCLGKIFGLDLWICDLAAQDPTYVLPLLMGVTMFIQQKMTPVSADPAQAKVMLIMPIFFTFMFLTLPSGLVLYWTVSNVLQIAQQWWMNKSTAASPAREAKNGSR
jgi:YidC/Oxa1 family membrane protein insertase